MRISRKIRIVQALLLGAPFFFGGCASPSKPRLSADSQAEALSHFSLGLLAASAGDIQVAFDHLQAAIRIDPTEEKLYAPAVAMALELKQTNDAVRLAHELTRRYPDTADPVLLLARVYALTGKLDQAESLFRSVLTDFPDNPEAPIYLARLYVSQDRCSDALEILRTASFSQSTNAMLFHLLGNLCIDRVRDLGDTPEAKGCVLEGLGFLKQSLAISPQNPLCQQQLGMALMSIGQPDEALKAFQEARRYAPFDLKLARQTFSVLIETSKYEEALAILDQLASETGSESELWLQYLAEKMPESESSRLTEYLEKHIRNEPQAEVFYYSQLGALYISAHKNQEAEAVLLKGFEHYPADQRLNIVLGYLRLQEKRYDEAYSALNRVRTETTIAEWSANPFFLFNFLTSSLKSGHLAEAAQTLETICTNSPAVFNQYINSLLTDRSEISAENAIDLLKNFLTLSPETPKALYGLMVLQAERKEYQGALEAARKIEELAQKSGDPDILNGLFYYQYAALYERTGQLEAAEKLFLKATESGEKNLEAVALNYIAYMWADRGEKLDEGLKLVHKALAIDPENGAFLDTLGWIYYMQGRYTEALTELQKAKSIVQNDSTVWEHLGDTYLKLNNRDEASKHWKKALELDPDSQRLKERLISTPTERRPAEDFRADTPPHP
ncbi:MAG: tetratricopeptide repeat protein [Verrucomicrobia bacterium]|nr:tetratricopeptide repeat protein [Verrucomicrobiota bacterium]